MTDAYRLHAALNRLCHTSIVWFYSGPLQKFVLRQVKAMDYRFVDDETRAREFEGKASYTSRDEHGQPIVNDAMDTALLVLYAHMLYCATSYQFGLSSSFCICCIKLRIELIG